MLSARGILAGLSMVFLGLAAVQLAQGHSPAEPAVRTWLIVGTIFGIVSAWLWFGRP
jgi:hypothetical protein